MLLEMPVKTKSKWYEVKEVLEKKKINGIDHYLVAFKRYKNSSWIPFFDLTPDNITSFNSELYKQHRSQRQRRWLEYRRRHGEEAAVDIMLGYDDMPTLQQRAPKIRRVKSKW